MVFVQHQRQQDLDHLRVGERRDAGYPVGGAVRLPPRRQGRLPLHQGVLQQRRGRGGGGREEGQGGAGEEQIKRGG